MVRTSVLVAAFSCVAACGGPGETPDAGVDAGFDAAVECLSEPSLILIPGGATDLAVDGTRLLVAGGAALHVLDVTDAPMVVTTVAGAATHVHTASGRVVVHQGSELVLHEWVGEGPVERARLDVAGTARAGLRGDRLYVHRRASGAMANTFESVSLVDVAAPATVATIDLAGHTPVRLTIAGGYAYAVAASSVEGELIILDVRDPSAPREVGRAPIALGQSAWDIIEDRGFLYIGLERAVVVFDVTDPTDPREVERHSGGRVLALGRGRLASLGARIQIFEVGAPGELTFVETRDAAGTATSATWVGDRLLATGPEGLQIFDRVCP